MTSPRLEVVSPRTGGRVPAWLDGEHVVALCGVVSRVVPVWVVFTRSTATEANALSSRLRDLGHPTIMEERNDMA